jgi:transcriptional regulator with XRE-family HTH domain
MPPKTEGHRIFGIAVRNLRERRGMSPASVALGMGLSKAAISEYELGLKAPKSLSRIEALCSALNTTDDERTALMEVWGSIGATNRIAHMAGLLKTASKTPMTDDQIRTIVALDPELRTLQEQISAIRKHDHDDAPFVVAQLLDYVHKMTVEATRWAIRHRVPDFVKVSDPC